jgi:hypothetical protein
MALLHIEFFLRDAIGPYKTVSGNISYTLVLCSNCASPCSDSNGANELLREFSADRDSMKLTRELNHVSIVVLTTKNVVMGLYFEPNSDVAVAEMFAVVAICMDLPAVNSQHCHSQLSALYNDTRWNCTAATPSTITIVYRSSTD